MIVVKNVPGLTMGELISTLRAVCDPEDRPPRTGDGGVVVGERTALSWLSLYVPSVTPPPELAPAQPPPPVVTQPPDPPAADHPKPVEPAPTPGPPPARTGADTDGLATRRARAPRKTTTTRAGGRHGGDL